jgi:hypothetical protein
MAKEKTVQLERSSGFEAANTLEQVKRVPAPSWRREGRKHRQNPPPLRYKLPVIAELRGLQCVFCSGGNLCSFKEHRDGSVH